MNVKMSSLGVADNSGESELHSRRLQPCDADWWEGFFIDLVNLKRQLTLAIIPTADATFGFGRVHLLVSALYQSHRAGRAIRCVLTRARACRVSRLA